MTRIHCTDDALANRLLDAVRRGTSPGSRDELHHLASCEACRIDGERLRRLLAARRVLEPSASESGAAFARFHTRVRRRTRVRWVPVVVAASTVLAMVATAVAGIAVIRQRVLAPAAAPAPTVHRKEPASRSRHVVRTPPPVTIPENLSSASDEELAAPAPVAGLREPASEHPGRESGPRPGPRALTGKRSSAGGAWGPWAPTAQVAEAAAASGSAAGAWKIAAESMRIGDFWQAERAFDRLAAAPDARTRDAARLARAELWLAEGRTGEARAALATLAREGATALIRRLATDALRGAR